MNNEPVAWMSEFGQFIGKVQDEICHIPLYTTPQIKELSDEEMLSEWNLISYCPKTYTWKDDVAEDLIIDFARAILKRAQEKC